MAADAGNASEYPSADLWQNSIGESFSSTPTRKPPYTLIELIGMAILAHDEQAPTVGEIYEWVSNKFLYYNQGDTGWKNSIRHTLSIKDHFIQAGHPQQSISGGGRTGRKSKTWKIDHRFRDHFRLEQVVEDGETIWKLKYIPSKVMSSKSGPVLYTVEDPVHTQRVRDPSPRKMTGRGRKGAATKQRRLDTLHEIGDRAPDAVAVVTAAPGLNNNMNSNASAARYTSSDTYQGYSSGYNNYHHPEEGLLTFPSVEGLVKSDADADDQKLVYIPRYDNRPRRKASLAACDVLTSLSTRIQAAYQV